jgi:hypothetical protein
MPDQTCAHLSPIGGWCRLKANFKCTASDDTGTGCPWPALRRAKAAPVRQDSNHSTRVDAWSAEPVENDSRYVEHITAVFLPNGMLRILMQAPMKQTLEISKRDAEALHRWLGKHLEVES